MLTGLGSLGSGWGEEGRDITHSGDLWPGQAVSAAECRLAPIFHHHTLGQHHIFLFLVLNITTVFALNCGSYLEK